MLDKVQKQTRSVEEMARLRSRLDYWGKKPRHKLPADAALLFVTELVLDVTIANPKDVRLGETVMVPVYRVGSLAKLLDRSVQTVRLWERQGYLPDSGLFLFGKKRGDERQPRQRCYTYAQMRVVYELLPLLDFGDTRGTKYWPFFREVWRAWMAMPDGIHPEYGKP